MRKGILFVLSGPSGAGKGTVLERVFRKIEGISYSVSATTRAPRSGEIDGVNYYFKTREEFDQMREEGDFLEYVYKFGNGYATIRSKVEVMLAQGKDVVLEIEVIGAEKVRKMVPDCVSIFISPSRVSELERRLIGRGSETDQNRINRITIGKEEVKCVVNYDYIAVNDDLDRCVDTVVHIIGAERAKVKVNQNIVNNFLNGEENNYYDD